MHYYGLMQLKIEIAQQCLVAVICHNLTICEKLHYTYGRVHLYFYVKWAMLWISRTGNQNCLNNLSWTSPILKFKKAWVQVTNTQTWHPHEVLLLRCKERLKFPIIHFESTWNLLEWIFALNLNWRVFFGLVTSLSIP